MRSTVDLIKELETESAQHFCCILPVAFENTSIMINPTDENRLQLLNAAIQQGGIPYRPDRCGQGRGHEHRFCRRKAQGRRPSA
jgi:hypothetical protein